MNGDWKEVKLVFNVREKQWAARIPKCGLTAYGDSAASAMEKLERMAHVWQFNQDYKKAEG